MVCGLKQTAAARRAGYSNPGHADAVVTVVVDTGCPLADQRTAAAGTSQNRLLLRPLITAPKRLPAGPSGPANEFTPLAGHIRPSTLPRAHPAGHSSRRLAGNPPLDLCLKLRGTHWHGRTTTAPQPLTIEQT